MVIPDEHTPGRGDEVKILEKNILEVERVIVTLWFSAQLMATPIIARASTFASGFVYRNQEIEGSFNGLCWGVDVMAKLGT